MSFIEAIIRYVEVKALVAGVTTSQGIALFSNANTRRYHRGLVRNVEDTDDPQLPEADTRIADVDDAASFLTRLQRGKTLILHLAEGVDEIARRHFQALQTDDGRWAITDRLVGIHAAGLTATDMATFAAHGGAMVWSPTSNLMLYGGTAAVAAAREEGVTVTLGSDWSPTGSKNLLRELQVARVAIERPNGLVVDRLAAAALGKDVESLVDDLLCERLLAVHHQLVDDLLDELRAVERVGLGRPDL